MKPPPWSWTHGARCVHDSKLSTSSFSVPHSALTLITPIAVFFVSRARLCCCLFELQINMLHNKVLYVFPSVARYSTTVVLSFDRSVDRH